VGFGGQFIGGRMRVVRNVLVDDGIMMDNISSLLDPSK
jgi:hypothetical protein